MRPIDDEYIEARIRRGPETYAGTPCWIWLAGTNGSGFPHGKCRTPMHRYTKTLYHSHEWKQGEMADHKCRRKLCINPDHIRVVNRRVNVIHGSDANRGSMAHRRLRVARWMHDELGKRINAKMKERADTAL